MNILATKSSLVHEIFVRTADENYIAAPWCAINKLNTDFLWLSVHALEKYLKAVLLLNGCSSIKDKKKGGNYSHDIVHLYADVKAIAGSLLPENLLKPAALSIGHWLDISPEKFMEILYKNGNADNRYLIYGYMIDGCYLHMLDMMVFAIRRLICPLDENFWLCGDTEKPILTNREELLEYPEYYRCMSMPLDTLIGASEDTPMRTAALNLNMAFAPKDYRHEPIRTAGISDRSPVIIHHILDPLESNDPKWVEEGIKIAEWFLENIRVPKGTSDAPGIAKQIDDAIKKAKIKHKFP